MASNCSAAIAAWKARKDITARESFTAGLGLRPLISALLPHAAHWGVCIQANKTVQPWLLPRISIPRTPVNKGKRRKGQSLVRLDPPHSRPLRKRETSRQQSGLVPVVLRRRHPTQRRCPRTLSLPPAAS